MFVLLVQILIAIATAIPIFGFFPCVLSVLLILLLFGVVAVASLHMTSRTKTTTTANDNDDDDDDVLCVQQTKRGDV